MKRSVTIILIIILLCSSLAIAGPLDFINLPGNQKDIQPGGSERSSTHTIYTRPSPYINTEERQQIIQAKIQAAKTHSSTQSQPGAGVQLTAARCEALLQQNPSPQIRRQCLSILNQQDQTAQTTISLAQCEEHNREGTMNQLSLEERQTCLQLLSADDTQNLPTLSTRRCQILLQNDPSPEILEACQSLTNPSVTQSGQLPSQQIPSPIQDQTEMSVQDCFDMYLQKSQGESFNFKTLQNCQEVLTQNKDSLTSVQCERIIGWNNEGEIFIPEILQTCRQKANSQTQLGLDKSTCFQMILRYTKGENIDQEIILECSNIIAEEITEDDCPKVLSIQSSNPNIFSQTITLFCQQKNTQQTATIFNQPRVNLNDTIIPKDRTLPPKEDTHPILPKLTGSYLDKPSYTILEAVIKKIIERF